MRRGFLSLLGRLALALGAVAIATVLAIMLRRFNVPDLQRITPFLFLFAILACSWLGGYASGITSVLITVSLGPYAARGVMQIDPNRLVLLLIVSISVSWIEHKRRHIETDLRARVQEKTAELTSAIGDLEREVHDRKAAEEEIRRLNQLLERRVDERTRQLEVSNQELESFSYSVSHDLRAPLRSIDGFSRILLESCSGKFDPEERSLFQRIVAAAGRMNELIDDLLNLSRVTRTSMHTESVDLSATARRIASGLLSEHADSTAEFVIEPGLFVNCDRRLSEVVLQNLLENALKFSSQSPNPRIEFGSTSVNGETALFVRDNGAGFDPAFKSKLFVPFQRLHRQEEFPGTGIGLATVSRIVRRHGGWISAEARLGAGATFFLTLGNSHAGAANYLPEEPKPPAPRLESASESSTQSTRT